MPRRRRPPRAGALSELQPLKIAAQIATLQLLYYAAALVLFLFTALVAGTPFGAGLILGWDRVRGDTTQGWVMAFVWILDGGLCMAIAIVALIARSKLVPDFAITIHALHLLITTIYSGSVPRSTMWWLAMAASSGLCIAVGMWGCRYRELQPVFFGGGRILGNNAPPPAAATNNTNTTVSSIEDGDDGGRGAGDEEMVLGRQKGRKDEYEMGEMRR
ncbi:hypothetical protein ACRE_009070 [Hapsidospora chrysogenum ATCC 11550]|uniref:Protein SYS1-like protein n=1 Tax=Hapsidospora chrysogenum (strain ATCC 11550 / CBS 779.69 / DSM 880 / IAM 14645 / JCM 23072 / IMI 49137) TaxID=857340 RepID=A0A086TFX5_HAPC1|nr:hypothetical protein ACRE_009070 [Hapsidospora chrysogenum ATCC 11550]